MSKPVSNRCLSLVNQMRRNADQMTSDMAKILQKIIKEPNKKSK